MSVGTTVSHLQRLDFGTWNQLQQVVVGLSFFVLPESKWTQREREPKYNDVAFSEFCTKFFDLDGHERISKFKLFKVSQAMVSSLTVSQVCSTVLDKKEAILITDSLYEVISGTFATITNQEFQQCLDENEHLRSALHTLMLLQSLQPGTVGHRKVMGWLKEATHDWVKLTSVGRSYAMEQLVQRVQGATEEELVQLSLTAEDYQRARRGIEAVYASYYLQVTLIGFLRTFARFSED